MNLIKILDQNIKIRKLNKKEKKIFIKVKELKIK